MSNLNCSNCYSEYEINERKLIVRDKDSIECEVCGTTIKKWNGAVTFSATLIRKGGIIATITGDTFFFREENADAFNTGVVVNYGPCEILSQIKTLNVVPSEFIKITGPREFYKIKNATHSGFVLVSFIQV